MYDLISNIINLSLYPILSYITLPYILCESLSYTKCLFLMLMKRVGMFLRILLTRLTTIIHATSYAGWPMKTIQAKCTVFNGQVWFISHIVFNTGVMQGFVRYSSIAWRGTSLQNNPLGMQGKQRKFDVEWKWRVFEKEMEETRHFPSKQFTFPLRTSTLFQN